MTEYVIRTGTVTVASGGTTVTGSGTAFLSLLPGALIWLGTQTQPNVVASIASNTSLTLQFASPSAVTGGTFTAVNVPGSFQTTQVIAQLYASIGQAVDVTTAEKRLVLASQTGEEMIYFRDATPGSAQNERFRAGLLAGDQNLWRIQRSANGTTWADAITINRTTGAIAFSGLTVTASQISDSTATGRSVLTAANAAAARAAIDAAPTSSPTFTNLATVQGGPIDTVNEAVRISHTGSAAERFHSLRARHSATAADNRLGLMVHNGSTTTSQTEVLSALGNGLVGLLTATPTDHLTIGAPSGGDRSLRINSAGATSIQIRATGTAGSATVAAAHATAAAFLSLATTSGGVESEAMRLTAANGAHFPGIGTTASAANAFLNSASSPANQLLRSTSSLAYKRDVETIDPARVDDFIAQARAVWYRSKAEADNPAWGWYGLIAEEVAAINAALVHWGYQEDQFEIVEIEDTREWVEGEGDEAVTRTETVRRAERRLKDGEQKRPDGVMYDRLTVFLLDKVQRQQAQIARMEARLSAIEARGAGA